VVSISILAGRKPIRAALPNLWQTSFGLPLTYGQGLLARGVSWCSWIQILLFWKILSPSLAPHWECFSGISTDNRQYNHKL